MQIKEEFVLIPVKQFEIETFHEVVKQGMWQLDLSCGAAALHEAISRRPGFRSCQIRNQFLLHDPRHQPRASVVSSGTERVGLLHNAEVRPYRCLWFARGGTDQCPTPQLCLLRGLSPPSSIPSRIFRQYSRIFRTMYCSNNINNVRNGH